VVAAECHFIEAGAQLVTFHNNKGVAMLAISALSSTMQGLFFLLALACFVAAGFSLLPGKKNLMAFGLAFYVFVFMWNAFAASS